MLSRISPDHRAGSFLVQPGRSRSSCVALPTHARATVRSEADQAEFLNAAPERLRLAFGLMLYTLQRPSDMLPMTRSQVMERDGRLYITLRQQQTGELVAAPVHRDLDPMLRARLADGTGGLRRTGVVRMAEAAVTTPQIAALGGWADRLLPVHRGHLSAAPDRGGAGRDPGLASRHGGAPASSVVRLSSAATLRPRGKGSEE
jgi:hypothetical protein